MVNRYILAKERNVSNLIQTVNTFIEKGFEPIGAPFYELKDDIWYQALFIYPVDISVGGIETKINV